MLECWALSVTNTLVKVRLELTRVELLTALHNGKLPADIRQGWKWLLVTNFLAYRGTELIYCRKKFYSLDPWD